MREDSAIDANTKNTAIGLVQGTQNETLPLSCSSDATNNMLLVEVFAVSGFSAYTHPLNMREDNNTKNTVAGIGIQFPHPILPLIVDEIVGVPFLRVEFM